MAKNKNENKYDYNTLFLSKEFYGKYQKDLAKVVLKDGFYTIDEAKTILNKYFNKK